jgi:tetratricopeptide (TPR) repeat protein
MSNANVEDTRPVPHQEEAPNAEPRPPWWRWALGGVLLLILVGALASFSGYRAGLNQRLDSEASSVAQQAEEQFALGIRDFEAGLYDVARQRFEFVIQLDPNFPGVTDRLADVLLALNTTATPTPVPTPTLTPTPDLRGAEDLFFQAERLMAEGDWTTALDTLDTLRQKQPDYRAVDVDGMYFVALRNRGIDKISIDGNLEGGMYDLARAELLGPLDRDADAWRSWARLYVLGASFWEVDWAQAISIFSQLIQAAPNLHDTANWTATERLRMALIRYGDQFVLAGDYCTAQQQYEAALQFGPDTNLEPTATAAAEGCAPPTPKPSRETNTPQVAGPPEGTNTPQPTMPPEEPTPTPPPAF